MVSVYFLSYVPLVCTWWWILQHKPFYFLYFVFVGLPLLEFLCPFPSLLRPRPWKHEDDVLLYLWYPVEIFTFLLFVHTKQHMWTDSLTMGLITALGINVAHELIHKHHPVHQWFGRRLLEWSGYGFWEWQHLKGHHKNIGQKNDPAIAPRGMTVYEFVPRCVIGTIKQAWLLDPRKFLNSMGITCCLHVFILSYFGISAALFHLSSACVSIVFLEIINYLEHYGLERSIGEPVQESHSWDAPYFWSSLLLFKLPFHSDHHLVARKHFSELEAKVDSPKYPFSYPVMVIVSLFPPLFFRMCSSRFVCE